MNNLRLQTKRISEGLPVLRCFDAELARRIHAVSASYTLLSEAKIAAEEFVRRARG